MEKPSAIANYFISKAVSENKDITPMKLVKLVYIAHGWNLAIKDKPLFDEDVQAWKYGPVIQSLYYASKNSSRKIDELLFESHSGYTGITYPKIDRLETDHELLDKVWDVYKDLDGPQLSTLTHKEGTPWYIVWHIMGGKEMYGAIIPNKIIKEYYRNKVLLKKPNINGN